MCPQLEYCSWDHYEKGDILSLEKVQWWAAHFVTGDYKIRESSATNMISTIGRQFLGEQRAIACLALMYIIVLGLVDVFTATLCPVGCQMCRTSHLSFCHLQSNTNCYRSSFFPCTIPKWHLLPLTLRSTISVQLFKYGLSQLDNTKILNSSRSLCLMPHTTTTKFYNSY